MQMKRIVLASLLALSCLLPAQAKAADEIVVNGSTTVLPIMQKVSEAYMAANPNVQIALSGGGSGKVRTAFKQTALHELIGEKTGAEMLYRPDWKFGRDMRDGLLQAYDADVTILPVGHGEETESEGDDRFSIRLSPSQEDRILKVAARAKKTVVIVYAGSAVDMSRWIDAVDAVVFAGFAGEGVNEALAALLCGEDNFSGKLTETFPLTLEDTYKGGDTFNGEADLYDDGIYVGYRYYDHANKEVLFPFGHGLSYAKFEYTNLKIEKKGDTDYELSYDITNVSDVAGKEVSQVYVKDVAAMVHRADKELKAFSKDLIQPHETKTVRVALDFSSFAYYSTALDKWHVENGWFEVYVGGSSKNLPLQGKINVELPEDTQYSMSPVTLAIHEVADGKIDANGMDLTISVDN